MGYKFDKVLGRIREDDTTLGHSLPATSVTYDNTTSGLAAGDVQTAVDELAALDHTADLGVANITATTLDVTSDTGTNATLPAATTSLAGLMTGADKTKLDYITVTGAVDLDVISSALADGDKGDITVSASGATWTIDVDVVTNAKAANMVENAIKARYSTGTGDPQDAIHSDLPNNLPVTGDYVFGWQADGSITTWPAARYLNTMSLGSATAAIITPQADSSSMNFLTALAQTLTINAPAGAAVNSQEYEFRFKDDGTPRTLNWDAAFTAPGASSLPTTTVAGETMFLRFLYNDSTLKWELQYSSDTTSSGFAPTAHTHVLADVTDVTSTAAEVNLLDLSGLTTGWVLAADGAATASWRQLLGSEINNDLGWVDGGGASPNVARWTDGNTLGSASLQDDGTTASAGGWAPDSGSQMRVRADGDRIWGFQAENTGSTNATNYGGSFTNINTSTTTAIGVQGSSTGTNTTNIGVYGAANSATSNYAAWLVDGTEGAGKFLKSITADGKANWATISASDISGGTLGETSGGTGQSTYATGDILYASGVDTLSRLAAGTDTHVLTLSGGVPTWAAPAGVSDGDKGDITVSGSGATWTIDNDVVSLAKMAHGTAGNLITYDAGGAPAAVATGTSGHVLTSNGAGAAPTFQAAPGGFTSFTLTGDSGTPETITDGNTVDIAGGTGISTVVGATDTVTVNHDAHTGDVTGSTTLTISNDAVTYAKMQNVSATDRLLGRDTAGAGDVEELTPAAVRTMLNVSETGAAANKPTLYKTVVVEDATSGDFIPIWRTDIDITIVEAVGILIGGTTSTTVQLVNDTDMLDTAANAIGTATAVTSNSTETSINIATDPTVDTSTNDQWIILKVTAGGAQSLVVNIEYTED